MSLNKVMLIGNLGADPELRHTGSGVAVCSLSVATTDKRKDQSGQLIEETEWHRVNVWKNAAENCAKYLSKGSKVFLEGKITTREYEKDGVKKYSTEIVAFSVQFLDSKGDKPQQGPANPIPAVDDIPF